MKIKVAFGGVGFWLLVPLVWASQNVLDGAVQGNPTYHGRRAARHAHP